MAEFVSVVIPTRNRHARLSGAIASVRAQTGVDLEIIVVDDASSDETPRVLQTLCKEEPRLRYVRNDSPIGGGGARNAGALLAKGEFVAFLDDDDSFLPGKLVRQVTALREQPSAPAASCSFFIDSGQRPLVLKALLPPRTREGLLRANVLGGASMCMVRAASFRHVGGFDPRLPSCQDWDLWLKLHMLGPIVVCPEPLVRYSFHADGQITGNVLAEYRGRRQIHLHYSGEMSEDLRRGSLAALIYCRRVRLCTNAVRRLMGLVSVMRIASGTERLTYLWRTFRFMVASQA